ncbi:hypothetical protein HPB50_016170 [Hyalomma asiaticum]|uniref:Uncharacterized protein n=1 Tax=Hyalomma asiaticum TaxID=266040 RepID=A0ACB7RNU4_HYAAI|nr:hypothetical protein HPB50_016170 [Hyalomma asiaticum]
MAKILQDHVAQAWDCDPDKPFREPTARATPGPPNVGQCWVMPATGAASGLQRLSRLVSMIIHPQNRTADQQQTNMAVMFAQFLAHDISLAAQAPPAEEVTDLGPGGNPTCLQGPECMPVEVPQNDDFYAQFNVTRLGMKRTHTCNSCGNGLMLSQDLGGDEYMPDSFSPYADHCSLPEENAFCLRAGDSRANQQPGILSMQTLWVREHNRIARRLACINPHWEDEELFLVTKRIQEGRYQHIVYAEWLPWHLGPAVMEEYDLWVRNTGRTSYDDTLDATLSTEFSSAHFRYSHTNVPGAYWRIDQNGESLAVLKLKDAYFVPLNDTYRPVDNVLRGSVVQPMEPFSRFGDHGLTHYLFRQRGLPYGGDLFALDIQRARDHGVRPYVDWVQLCQNISITSFADLSQVMPEETARLYEQVYEDVRDIDLFSGALSEAPLKGAEVGATFACGVASQLRRLKYGDRFYYEHSNQSGSFSDGFNKPDSAAGALLSLVSHSREPYCLKSCARVNVGHPRFSLSRRLRSKVLASHTVPARALANIKIARQPVLMSRRLETNLTSSDVTTYGRQQKKRF